MQGSFTGPKLLPLLAASTLLLLTSQAQADPTGWAYIGAGPTSWKGGDLPESELRPTLTLDTGIGSEPIGPVILGGIVRVQPLFGEGIDLALAGRIASRGFRTAMFGMALDLGGYQRFWDPQSTGLFGQATIGGPFGLQIAIHGKYGTNDSHSIGGTAGIDFVRLALSRDYLTNWWPNPKPFQNNNETLPVGMRQGIPLRF